MTATKARKGPVPPPWQPPVPSGEAYALQQDGWLLVEVGADRPDQTHWVPLRGWSDGALLCWPARPAEVPSGICRWSLECTTPAVVTIPHGTYGPIDACAAHAEDYRLCSATLGSLNNTREADPECWCPDRPNRPGGRLRVDYCPTHGRGPTRGIDQLADPAGPLYHR